MTIATQAAAHAITRAFLEALREPTTLMQEAMSAVAYDDAVDASLAAKMSSPDLPEPVWMKTWKAGIEAAIGELGG